MVATMGAWARDAVLKVICGQEREIYVRIEKFLAVERHGVKVNNGSSVDAEIDDNGKCVSKFLLQAKNKGMNARSLKTWTNVELENKTLKLCSIVPILFHGSRSTCRAPLPEFRPPQHFAMLYRIFKLNIERNNCQPNAND